MLVNALKNTLICPLFFLNIPLGHLIYNNIIQSINLQNNTRLYNRGSASNTRLITLLQQEETRVWWTVWYSITEDSRGAICRIKSSVILCASRRPSSYCNHCIYRTGSATYSLYFFTSPGERKLFYLPYDHTQENCQSHFKGNVYILFKGSFQKYISA